jgi:hypothetical protein
MKLNMKHLGRAAVLGVAAIIGIVLTVPSLSAAQQTTCGQRGEMELALSTRFGEMPFSTGTAGQNLVKFYVNPSTGSWTAIAVTPDGGACIFAAGSDFEPVSAASARVLGPAS